METRQMASKMVTLRVPAGSDSWIATDFCEDALHLYKIRGEAESAIRNLGPARMLTYTSGRKVAVISRAGGCAEVRFIDEGRDLYIAGSLVPQSPDERAAAVRSAALAKQQADRDARERARAAGERAELQGKCTAVFKGTGNKKVSDLTVVESQQVQACTALGMYHP